MRLFRDKGLTCEQVVELVTDYLEGAMSERDTRRFDAHLSGCDHCGEYLRQMQTTILLTGQLRREHLSRQAQRELTDLFRRWRQEST